MARAFWVVRRSHACCARLGISRTSGRPGPVVYCALEGAHGFRNRIEAFRQAKLSEADGGDPPFFLMAASLSLVADREALIGDIRKQLDGRLPVAICLDTLNRSLKGSESSDEDMAAYIRATDSIRDAFDCLVLIVHHCGHDGSRPRGHSSLMGALDVQIAVVATPLATSSPSLSCPKMEKSDCNLCRVLFNGTLPLTKMATASLHASLRRLKGCARLARAAPRRGPHKQPCDLSAKPSRNSASARQCRTPFPLRRAS